MPLLLQTRKQIILFCIFLSLIPIQLLAQSSGEFTSSARCLVFFETKINSGYVSWSSRSTVIFRSFAILRMDGTLLLLICILMAPQCHLLNIIEDINLLLQASASKGHSVFASGRWSFSVSMRLALEDYA